MRNLLEEFRANHGLRPPTILGVREHVFTGRFDIIVIVMTVCRYFKLMSVFLIYGISWQCFLFGLVHVQSRN